MKSSTLHRSNLSRERMSMIENVRYQSPVQYTPVSDSYLQKKPELDVLWRNFERNVQSSRQRTKAPVVYAGIGFVLGLLFSLGIAVIIGLSTYNSANKVEYSAMSKVEDPQATVSIVPSDTKTENSNVSVGEQKYTIKEGDTLDDVAYRFYGKYDLNKIEEIMKLNNIKDATTIQIGQVLIIPVE